MLLNIVFLLPVFIVVPFNKIDFIEWDDGEAPAREDNFNF